MKKPAIIVFIIILAIHLLALGLFLMSQQGDDPEKKPDPNELVPEPEIDPESIKKGPETTTSNKVPGTTKPPKVTPGKNPPTQKTPSGFYVSRKFPSFEFKGAVTGNLSAVPSSKGARAGILVDLDTGKVLWAKNATKAVPIASMTKMMTVLITYEAIRGGHIDYDTEIRVSKTAASIGGSDIWLDPRESFPLKVLLKAIIIKSANDAAQLVGETLGDGKIEVFVKKMNKRAEVLGLKKTKFYNPHGLPGSSASKDNVATCEELAKIAALLLQYPDVLKMSSTGIDYVERKIGKHKKTMLTNTNNLVRKRVKGVDGMKTGFTRRAGSCLTATCKRDGRRLIAVVTGFNKASERDDCIKKLLDWGYSQ
jgi:D-alanyl-D-alanine carboxypeptidase (penicillin-binding protein 5/6)